VLALIVPAVLAGCDATSSPESVDPITVDVLMAHVAFLSDDSLYGRRAGWEDELTAAEYVRDRFVAAGVSPGLSGYLQEFWVGSPVAASAFGPGGDPHRVARPWSQNVIGVLPGAGALADEWIVVGAHYDHIGWSLTPDSALVVYNGADDNGSGTAVLIELARYLASRSRAGEASGSRRSIMFQGYGAEEIGLVGSTYYCENPIVPLTQVAAMVNFDMVGRLRNELLTVGGANSASWWPARLAAANTDGFTLYEDNKYVGRTDHACFYQAGRPAVHLFTGTHAEYHTPLDDPPLLNTEGLLRIAEFAARLVEDLAAAPTLSGN
jgi:hypothetical protein